MPWEVVAICERCGKRSEIAQRRSFLASVLKHKGWVKGKPGQIFCPECWLREWLAGFGTISDAPKAIGPKHR